MMSKLARHHFRLANGLGSKTRVHYSRGAAREFLDQRNSAPVSPIIPNLVCNPASRVEYRKSSRLVRRSQLTFNKLWPREQWVDRAIEFVDPRRNLLIVHFNLGHLRVELDLAETDGSIQRVECSCRAVENDSNRVQSCRAHAVRPPGFDIC